MKRSVSFLIQLGPGTERREEQTTEQVKLGRSGLEVSRLAFGTWQLGGDWGVTDERRAIKAIRRAAEQGVTLFDTAQAYGFGASEAMLKKALHGYDRDDFVLATKGGLRPAGLGVARDSRPAWIRAGVEESLKALGTDRIDLFQVHWPDLATPFEETAGALADLVTEGKILHVGVSNFDVGQMRAFDAALSIETLQPPYHLFRRGIEPAILPFAVANDIGVLVYGPLAHGLLGGGLRPDTEFPRGDWRGSSPAFRSEALRKNLTIVDKLEQLATRDLGVTLSQLAIAWTLANPAVQVAILGTRDASHVDEAVSATELHLSDDLMSRISELVAGAAPVEGPTPESMPH